MSSEGMLCLSTAPKCSSSMYRLGSTSAAKTDVLILLQTCTLQVVCGPFLRCGRELRRTNLLCRTENWCAPILTHPRGASLLSCLSMAWRAYFFTVNSCIASPLHFCPLPRRLKCIKCPGQVWLKSSDSSASPDRMSWLSIDSDEANGTTPVRTGQISLV